jgi:dipeptidyl aminopeptidase/acylaminoacyl peptidase
MRLVSVLVCSIALIGAGCASDDEPETVSQPTVSEPATTEARQVQIAPFSRLTGITTVDTNAQFGEGLALWQEQVPRIEDVRIRSTADGSRQPALWLSPRLRPAPLLVVLHSWSSGYLQHSDLPFAAWAEQNGWAMIAPDFRGVNLRPQATGSDLAVQDVVDSIDFAVEQGGVDEERVFVIGYSGGGMMSLLVASRHPDRFAGVASWVPVYDVVDWYGYVRDNLPQEAYAGQIIASCGGDPSASSQAQKSCRKRSPQTYIAGARDAGVPIYLAQGLSDDRVPPHYAALAFNQLAEPADRLDEAAVRALSERRLSDNLQGSVETETYFGTADPTVFFARASGPVTLVFFDGGHDMVYHPGLAWMHRIASRP